MALVALCRQQEVYQREVLAWTHGGVGQVTGESSGLSVTTVTDCLGGLKRGGPRGPLCRSGPRMLQAPLPALPTPSSQPLPPRGPLCSRSCGPGARSPPAPQTLDGSPHGGPGGLELSAPAWQPDLEAGISEREGPVELTWTDS